MANPTPERHKLKAEMAIDRAVPMQSVQHLISDANNPNFADHRAPIPAPKELAKETASLKKLRQADVWKQDNRDLQVMQMAKWFPSIRHSREDGAVYDDDELFPDRTKPKVIMAEKEMVDDSITSTIPISDIGTLANLPGEIRNCIYRYAVLQSQQLPIEITLKPRTCASGACLHAQTGHNVPDLAQTCAQLRSEVLSIFIAENSEFRFDADSTQQCCVGNWLRSLGSFADRVPKITVTVTRAFPINHFFTITVPGNEMHGRVAGEFEMQQQLQPPRQLLCCDCSLRVILKRINVKWTAGDTRTGKLLEEFVDSEELADFVWQVNNSQFRMWPAAKCKVCGQTMLKC